MSEQELIESEPKLLTKIIVSMIFERNRAKTIVSLSMLAVPVTLSFMFAAKVSSFTSVYSGTSLAFISSVVVSVYFFQNVLLMLWLSKLQKTDEQYAPQTIDAKKQKANATKSQMVKSGLVVIVAATTAFFDGKVSGLGLMEFTQEVPQIWLIAAVGMTFLITWFVGNEVEWARQAGLPSMQQEFAAGIANKKLYAHQLPDMIASSIMPVLIAGTAIALSSLSYLMASN